MDRGNYRIVHFSAEGKLLDAFGAFGIQPENIHTGWDIALDADDNIYICNITFSEESDLHSDGSKVFTPHGTLLREIGKNTYARADAGDSHKPYGLDVDARGHVYLADFDSNTLRVFAPDGQILGTFFGEKGADDGQFHGINDVVVDNLRGLLYLTDNTNCRIQQFALTWTPVLTLTHRLSFGNYGAGPGQLAYPQGMAVHEPSGELYVADHANQRVQVFDTEGRALRSFAPQGISTWQVLQVDVSTDGRVYATDSFNNAIWVFDTMGNTLQRIEVLP